MATSIARICATKLIRPCQSSSVCVFPTYSISQSPKPFSSSSSSPFDTLFRVRTVSKIPVILLKKPINHDTGFFRFYSNFGKKFNPPLQLSEISRDPIGGLRFFSTPCDDTNSEEVKFPGQNPESKQEDTGGPTIQRDFSALANETRQELDGLLRTIFDLSIAVALLGFAQLACSAWIFYISRSSSITELSIQSLVAFAFPFSLAFFLRRSLKPMCFSWRMEEQGRLQILGLTQQIAKNVDLFFVRVCVVSLICSVGMSVGLLFTVISG